MDDLEPLGGNEARDRLRPACVRLKGDHDGRFLAELTSDPQEFLGRRGAKGRILKVRRAAHEGRTAVDRPLR
ncbi:hypothetical protein AB0E67_12185 [Streptomyces sp. NPDC032161]|uniref:hypothetical protein n=1 Tax=unclassified Streptomyces TaxID=2593676 RepID=UPI00340F9E14